MSHGPVRLCCWLVPSIPITPMKMLFSVLALVVALLLVLLAAKTQMQGLTAPAAGGSTSATGDHAGLITPQQYKQELEQAMHASRPAGANGSQP